MYERFMDRARKVLQRANQEAQRFNHDYIGTEHILLGLVKEGSGVAANVLKNLGIDLPNIRRQIEMIVEPSPPGSIIVGKLPQTPRAKKAIEYAIEEARSLNHTYVGTEHLLLGLLREGEGVGAQILMNLGLELEWLREEVVNLLGCNSEPPLSRVLINAKVHELRVEDLPAEIRQALLPFDTRIEALNQQKEGAIIEWGFERAAHLRDQADKLKESRKSIILDWCRRPLPDPAWLAWQEGTVASIARAIEGEQRWGDLPILADALEEAGCTDQEILHHCRQPGDHGGGCWVVALLLGKR